MRHSISEDVPSKRRGLVTRGYWAWIFAAAGFCMDWLTITIMCACLTLCTRWGLLHCSAHQPYTAQRIFATTGFCMDQLTIPTYVSAPSAPSARTAAQISGVLLLQFAGRCLGAEYGDCRGSSSPLQSHAFPHVHPVLLNKEGSLILSKRLMQA